MSKGSTTDLTLVGTLSSVDSHVYRQLGVLGESGITGGTLEGPHTQVKPHMLLEVTLEGLATQVAGVGSGATVDCADMLIHPFHSYELLTTRTTLELLDAAVGH